MHAHRSDDELARERQVRDVFLACLDLPPDRRRSHVEQVLEDPDLRIHVLRLVARHEEENAEPGDAIPRNLGGYVISAVLGRGASATVFMARREDREDPVALKVLRPGSGGGELGRRFRREAEILLRLDHEGIAGLVEAGVLPPEDGGGPYLAMEYVPGEDLRAWQERTRPSDGRILNLVADVARILAHAHEAGVVHRDLKPENIRVRPDGCPVVLDFGVSRLVDPLDAAATLQTRAGQIIGTLRYMSPEQLSGEEASPASDLYSLAVVAYELFSGSMPYDVPDTSLYSAVVAVASNEARCLPEGSTPGRPGVATFLDNALIKDPGRRYGSAAAFLRDLETAREGGKIRPRPRECRRGVLGRAVALAAVLFLVVVFLGPIRSVWRGDVPVETLRTITEASVLARRLLHEGPRTPESAAEAVGALEEATALLHEGQGRERTLRWLLEMQLGEAYLIQGIVGEDVTSYERARSAYSRAGGLFVGAAELDALPAEWTIRQYSYQVMPHQAWAGMGTAAAAIGEIREGAIQYPSAVVNLTRGRDELLRSPTPRGISGSLRRWHRAIARNDLARASTRLGVVMGDSAAVTHGLALFRDLGETDWWRTISGGSYASYRLGVGEAFYQRHRLGGPAADLDSAQVHLAAAWSLAGSRASEGMYGRIAVRRSQVARSRAETVAAPEGVSLLKAARDELAFVVEDLADMSRVLPKAEAERELARLDESLAVRTGDDVLMADVRTRLAELSELVDPERFPREAGEILLARARVAGRLGLEAEREGCLQTLRRLLPDIQRPGFEARVEAFERQSSSSRSQDRA